MVRARFPLSSDQLELLLAFEQGGTLQSLSESMAKDPSVVSRNLQQLAEASPVIVKVKGRWQISPLGIQVNERTRTYLSSIDEVLKTQRQPKAKKVIGDNTALIVINAQNGLSDNVQGNRHRSEAEINIGKILASWRRAKGLIIHVRHASDNPRSAFYKGSDGFKSIPDLAPEKAELVIDKTKSSAFAETSLLQELNSRGIETIVLTGFTANECIDATARQASELGFATFVVGDASASFDVFGPDGKLYRAERIHKLTLANLHALFAKVVLSEDILKNLDSV
ncbi:MAG: cysteine hydrolase family protein [Oligoflexales bacterium]